MAAKRLMLDQFHARQAPIIARFLWRQLENRNRLSRSNVTKARVIDVWGQGSRGYRTPDRAITRCRIPIRARPSPLTQRLERTRHVYLHTFDRPSGQTISRRICASCSKGSFHRHGGYDEAAATRRLEWAKRLVASAYRSSPIGSAKPLQGGKPREYDAGTRLKFSYAARQGLYGLSR
jgi:hypothetical protein